MSSQPSNVAVVAIVTGMRSAPFLGRVQASYAF
jgi:hypothetical protein